MIKRLGCYVLSAGLLLLPLWGQCESSQEKLERAVYLEESAGKIADAATLYSQLVQESAGTRVVCAEAGYRLALCHFKLGEKSKAVAELDKLVRDFPEQTKVVEKAKAQLAVLNSAAPAASKAPQTFASGGQVEGIWAGTLQVPTGTSLRVVFHIRREADGSLSASLDSPDQNTQGIPVDEMAVEGDTLRLKAKLIGGALEVRRSTNSQLTGTWTQGGVSLPLVLARTATSPAIATPAPRQEISVPVAVLDTYVGQYALAPQFSIAITREGNGLFAQATKQAKIQIYPETESIFFYKVVEAQIRFVKNSQGQVDQLVLHQNGRDLSAKRIR